MGLMALSLLGFLGEGNLFLDTMSHFRVQYYLVSCVFLIFFILMRSWRWAVAGILPVALNGFMVFFWFVPPADAQAVTEAKPNLRILIANVEKWNQEHAGLISMIREVKADIVVLPETDFEWAKALAQLRGAYAYQVSRPRADCLGMTVFSKFPVYPDAPMPPFRRNGIDEVYVHGMKVLGPAENFYLIAAHPMSPVNEDRFRARNFGLDQIAELAEGRRGTVIVAGDINTTMWSPYYWKLMRRTGLKNARKGFGILQSWPAFLMEWMRLPLDHCLVSPGIKVHRIRTGRPNGSDHLPVIVDLEM